MNKITDYKYLIEQTGGMNVPGIVYTSEKMIPDIGDDPIQQVRNVACLPGIEKYSIAMPDIHSGYGFTIGGVAAFDIDKGVISPGGVGYDINCGVRLILTNLDEKDAASRLEHIADTLYKAVPGGVGSSGEIALSEKEIKKVAEKGAAWAVENGYGDADDLRRTEEGGALDFDHGIDGITKEAYKRGLDQLGTLGAGNHFLEVQKVDKIFLPETAAAFNIHEGMIVVMLHTGSRGFGYQVCGDFLGNFSQASLKYGINLPDRQLACVPVKSPEGREYFNAMSGAANFAWANRQVITHRVRSAFEQVFKAGWSRLGMRILYDVSHNIARMEEHEVDRVKKTLCVHRKGATRSLPAGNQLIPEEYRELGQPVLIPGDMGRASYILLGSEGSAEAFYSTSHGAGRVLSRTAAAKKSSGSDVIDKLRHQGILVRSHSTKLIAEEAPYAYKDVEDVTETVEKAGLSKRVARLKPLAVIKG